MEQHSISSDFIRGHIDTIILHSIVDTDKFAQQISDSIDKKSQNKYQINQATLYSSLKRLESLGYVKSYWNDSSDGRRKFIKITDSGKSFLEENMSTWSYSRAIIDKLMDVETEPVVKYVEIEKIVEKSVVSPVLNDSLIQNTTESSIKTVDELPKNLEATAENCSSDIAFRNILGDLIKSTEIKHEKINTQPNCDEIVQSDENSQKKLKLHDTIDDVDYIPQNCLGFNKIDFSDLIESAKKSDLKIKVSSKNSVLSVGNVLRNKLNFVSSIFIFAITLLQFLFISLNYSNIIGATSISTVLCVIALCVFPVTNLIIYTKKPKKACGKVSADTILVSFIVAFNVILIAFALNLLLNVNFSETGIIILSLIVPIILTIDAVIYYVIRYFLSKLKLFKFSVK